jgi:6,7-dimethyl-8-ribityllumazine synthase
MLKPVTRRKRQAAGGRFAIIASRYNARYVGAMLKAAEAELLSAGVEELNIIRVPGAFEIPAVAARLAWLDSPSFDAIICLGVILRGQTTHAEHIGTGVTNALIELQVRTGRPMIHEVLLLENEAQAKARCLGKEHNRGAEAAQTALAMAAIMRSLPTDPSDDEVPF